MTPMIIPFRYTKAQIDSTNEFTISVPLGEPIPSIAKVCGMQSGRILTLQFRNGELQGLFFTEIYNHLSTN